MAPPSEQAWTITAIPFLHDNYAWAFVAGSDALVVDPGEPEPVAQWLRDRKVRLRAILVTHHHNDHIGGVAGLKRYWPDAVVYGPVDPRIDGVDQRVRGGEQLVLRAPAMRFDVLDIPGHTATHIAFHGEGLLFCGDTLFGAGCGRLFEGTPTQMLASLDALAALGDDTLVCCGHEYTVANCRFALVVEPGNRALQAYTRDAEQQRHSGQPTLPSTLAREREVNPFLRTDVPDVRHALVERRGLPELASRADAFAAMRAWKDVYRD